MSSMPCFWIAFVLIGLVSAQSPVPAATVAATNATTTTTTTTSAPPVTTDKSTTTTTTTTAAPTTTTTAKPTPTPVPTVPPTPAPVPKPESFTGNVTAEGVTCINVKFSVQIVVKYNNTNNTELETGFTIPVNSTVNPALSYCNSTSHSGLQAIGISFVNEEHTSANLTLTFNKTEDKVYVHEVLLSFNLTKELFPQLKDSTKYGSFVTATEGDLKLFNVATEHSYVCEKAQEANPKADGFDIQIDFLSTKVEAYIDGKKSGVFDSEIDCKSTEISDVVPIAVGAALAGLVVIVLIAYFIGRRRSRRLAYQSV